MDPIETFLWGVGGSVAVEAVSLYNYTNSRSGLLPKRYKRVAFWMVRMLLAIVAGGLALAYAVQTPIVAIHIGAATPLILQTLARTAPKIDQQG